MEGPENKDIDPSSSFGKINSRIDKVLENTDNNIQVKYKNKIYMKLHFFVFLFFYSCLNENKKVNIVMYDRLYLTGIEEVESNVIYKNDTLSVLLKDNKNEYIISFCKDCNNAKIKVFESMILKLSNNAKIFNCSEKHVYKTILCNYSENELYFTNLTNNYNENIFMFILVNMPKVNVDAINAFNSKESNFFVNYFYHHKLEFNYSYITLSDKRGILSYTKINNKNSLCIEL